ncbi:MAG: response regulator [Desulfocucumaceae bacterium]
MQKVKVIVVGNKKVIRGGVASILNSAEHLEVVGREGADAFKEAYKLQPDLLVYEISSSEEEQYSTLTRLKDLCGWTKIIIFSSFPLKGEEFKKFLGICDSYLQGPLLPGFLLKAVELACYSGYFFYLGSSNEIKPELGEVQNLPPIKFPGKDQYEK